MSANKQQDSHKPPSDGSVAKEEFIRVGTSLYKIVEQPRLNGGYVKKRIAWNNETLRQDYGKDYIGSVPKYDGFCTVPEHIGYRPVVGKFLNLYEPIDHRPKDKELHFIHNGKPYFAIGFPNVAGGFEVRNRFFKGCIAPKDISHICQQGEPREKCLVFEGMMDYLSFLTLRMRNCPIIPNLDGQDYIILNSIANVSKAIDVLHRYERIHCLFDNDEAGRNAYLDLAREFSGRICDFSDNYNGHKDLNDYLCDKPMSQSEKTITEKKQVQSARRMIQPPKKKGLKM